MIGGNGLQHGNDKAIKVREDIMCSTPKHMVGYLVTHSAHPIQTTKTM